MTDQLVDAGSGQGGEKQGYEITINGENDLPTVSLNGGITGKAGLPPDIAAQTMQADRDPDASPVIVSERVNRPPASVRRSGCWPSARDRCPHRSSLKRVVRTTA